MSVLIHEGSSESKRCSCCPTMTVRVQGTVEDRDDEAAWYMASWTPRHADLISMVLVLEPYDDADDDAPGTAFCLKMKHVPGGIGMGFVEPDEMFSPVPDDMGLVSRAQALEHPEHQTVKDYFDAIIKQDSRIDGVLTATKKPRRRKRSKRQR